MAHTKSAGHSKNTRDSNPQYLGIKISEGGFAKAGSILFRQKGTKFLPGINVGTGKDYTLFALTDGKVYFTEKKKRSFAGIAKKRKVVNIKPVSA